MTHRNHGYHVQLWGGEAHDLPQNGEVFEILGDAAISFIQAALDSGMCVNIIHSDFLAPDDVYRDAQLKIAEKIKANMGGAA